MYAGRYLWWNMMAAIGYLFFAIYFYYLEWVVMRLSNCASVAGSCGALDAKLNGLLRPYGLLAMGIVVLTAAVFRIWYLRISPIWGLALFIWFGASAEFFFNFGSLWFARIDMVTILSDMPVEVLFLAALIAFLSFPLELYPRTPEGGLRVIYYVAGFTASYSFTLSLANSAEALELVRRVTRSETIAASFEVFQQQTRFLLGMGAFGPMPLVVALGIFISALTYLLAMRRTPGGLSAPMPA